MKIKTVKIQGSGYLVNGKIAVPHDPANRHYQLIAVWIEAGNTPEPEFDEADLKEQARIEAKTTRDAALNDITHTFADGAVIQVRPQDLANFEMTIAKGQDRKWIMANNDVRLTTIAELQEAMDSGISQGETIWDDYIARIESL